MKLKTIILSEISQKRKTNTIWYHLYVELRYDTNEPIPETESQRTDWWLPRQRRVGGKMEWEAGVSRPKLLYISWMNNKVLLSNTGNYTLCHMITIFNVLSYVYIQTHTVFLNILFHYVCIAEPLYCMAIINKTLQINYNFKKWNKRIGSDEARETWTHMKNMDLGVCGDWLDGSERNAGVTGMIFSLYLAISVQRKFLWWWKCFICIVQDGSC